MHQPQQVNFLYVKIYLTNKNNSDSDSDSVSDSNSELVTSPWQQTPGLKSHLCAIIYETTLYPD